ncbi:MAG: O-antigen ligase family protein [Armatimonadia bacterium]
MKLKVPDFAIILIICLLPLLPLLAGKLWVWQALLVVLVVAAALLVYLLAGKPSPRAALPGDLIDWALALFILWSAFSWFVSVYRFASEVYLAKLLACAGVFWLLRYGLRREKLRHAALWGLVGGGALLGVLGLREYVRTVHFLGDTQWRVFGPMFNPNIAAGYLLLTVFPALALLFGGPERAEAKPPIAEPVPGTKKRQPAKKPAPSTQQAEQEPPPRYREIATGFAVLLMLATLLLTGSKAALGAFLIGGVIFGLLAFGPDRKGKLARLVILGLVGVMVVMAFSLPPIRTRIVNAFGWQSHSAVFRAYTWQSTLHMIADRPVLGFGAGAYENAFPRYAIAGFTRQAHQAFLQIAAESGLPALAFGLLFGLALLWKLWRLTRGDAPALRRLLGAAAVAGLVASSLQELADYAWYVPAVGLSFFALAGLGLAGGQTAPAEPQQAQLKRTGWHWVAVALTAGLALWSVTCLYGEVVLARADAQAMAGAYTSAAETYAAAARLNPRQARVWVQQSKVDEALAGGGEAGALDGAIAARQRAVALQPTEPLHHLALARLYEEAGRLPDALQQAQQALQLYPNYPRGLATLARLQQASGQKQQALQTYQRLQALHRSPVGLYPPVAEMPDTAFAYGWLGTGDHHWERGEKTLALLDYYQAVRLLRDALTLQMSAQAKTGEQLFGRMEDDAALARELRARLMRDNRALSVMMMVQLHQALREADEARNLLDYVVSGRAETRLPSDQLAAAWARLELANLLKADKQEGAAMEMAKKGLHAAKAAEGAAPDALSREGWTPDEAARLQRVSSSFNSL